MSARRPPAGSSAIRVAVVLAGLAVAWPGPGKAEFPSGDGRHEVVLDDVALTFFTYKPAGYDGKTMIVVVHGLARNAEGYRDYARVLGDRHRALIVAPLFDKQRFRTADFQHAGIATATPPEKRAGGLLLALIGHARREEGRPAMAYLLIGHSGGGQFLSRLAAFVPSEARRIVVANPGTYVAPTREQDFPYGFGGLSEDLAGDAQIRAYLAAPVTVYLGTADTGDRNLSQTEGARRQGENRHRRGLAVFRQAERTARDNGWTFGWRLVEAPAVGHSAREMFADAMASRALFAE